MIAARTVALQGIVAVLLSLASLWAATQWAASMLGYQPALGPPLVDLAILKLYAPWQLFTWWLAFDTQAPHIFAPAGAVAALGGVLSGAFAIGGTARRAGRRSRPRPTARLAGRILAMSARPACCATAVSSPASMATGIYGTMGPSMSWRWHRRDPARASA
jgi:hypothetical protein